MVPAFASIAALLLGFVLADRDAAAAGIRIAAESGTAATGPNHTHHCKCRMHCRSACCCSPGERHRQASLDRTAADAVGGGSPCLEAAPCDGPAIPHATDGPRSGAPAALAGVSIVLTSLTGTLVPIPRCQDRPSVARMPIDEPPEHSVPA
jgi:hypothetical protein